MTGDKERNRRNERLDKAVADREGLTRKEARDLIRKGRVRVNGEAAGDPARKVGEGDRVHVDGRELSLKPYVYLMMNKPAGVLSATRDREGKTVLDLLPPHLSRKGLFPAGRLDKDTEGFVLLTNDGQFAHRMLAPKSHVPKTYHALLDGPVGEEVAAAFARGMDLGEGDVTSPAELRLLEEGQTPLAELVIYEGMFHQVKRMFATCGLEVLALRRVGIGSVTLDPALAPGECRELVESELCSF